MKPMSSSRLDKKKRLESSRRLCERAWITLKGKARPAPRDRPWDNQCHLIWAIAFSISIQAGEGCHIRLNSIPKELIGILLIRLDKLSDRIMSARIMSWIQLSPKCKRVQLLSQRIESLKHSRKKRRSQVKKVRSRTRRLATSIWQWDKPKMKGSRLIHQACWDSIEALSEIWTTRRCRTALVPPIDWIDSMASEVCANLFPDPRPTPIAILAGLPQH